MNKLYEGKTFYELIKGPNSVEVVGPLNTIFYINKDAGAAYCQWSFVEVVNGLVKRTFTEDEILVIQE